MGTELSSNERLRSSSLQTKRNQTKRNQTKPNERMSKLCRKYSSSSSSPKMGTTRITRKTTRVVRQSSPAGARRPATSTSVRTRAFEQPSELVSRCVKADADLVWFEQFAGRSAMLGFLNALLYEGATGVGVFESTGSSTGAMGDDLFLFFARASAGAALLLSVICTRTSLPGGQLPQDVKQAYKNFTASNSASQIDRVVDELFENISGAFSTTDSFGRVQPVKIEVEKD